MRLGTSYFNTNTLGLDAYGPEAGWVFLVIRFGPGGFSLPFMTWVRDCPGSQSLVYQLFHISKANLMLYWVIFGNLVESDAGASCKENGVVLY